MKQIGGKMDVIDQKENRKKQVSGYLPPPRLAFTSLWLQNQLYRFFLTLCTSEAERI